MRASTSAFNVQLRRPSTAPPELSGGAIYCALEELRSPEAVGWIQRQKLESSRVASSVCVWEWFVNVCRR